MDVDYISRDGKNTVKDRGKGRSKIKGKTESPTNRQPTILVARVERRDTLRVIVGREMQVLRDNCKRG